MILERIASCIFLICILVKDQLLVLLVMRPVPINIDMHKFIAGKCYLTELMGICVCTTFKGQEKHNNVSPAIFKSQQ